jgi:hypothetical protein
MPELNIYSGGRWVAVSGVTGGDSAVTVHDGSIPNPAEETPNGLEDSLAAYADGLHYFKESGTLLAITRQQYQTDITLTGPVSSVAKIVKSDAGLPTPQNPSLIVIKSVDGQWIKMTSDELDKPFGQPQMADPFDIPKTLFDKDIRLGNVTLKSAIFQDAYKFYVDNVGIGVRPVIEYSDRGQVTRIIIPSQDDVYTKTESESRFLNQQYFTDNAYYGPSVTFKDTFGTVRWKTSNFGDGTGPDAILAIAGWGDPNVPNSPVVPRLYFEATNEIGGYLAYADDTYTKKEVDAKLDADKDFSIANDNVLLASITSLQEIVTNLGEVGTGQMDVLTAIKSVEIEPSSIKLTGDAASPIQWKGGLSLAPVKSGADWRLHWNDGKTIHTLVHADEFTTENIVAALNGQNIQLSDVYLQTITSNNTAFAGDNGRIMAQKADGGPVETVAYLSDIPAAPAAPDLSSYAKLNDPGQLVYAKAVSAEGFVFGATAGLRYMDTGEGYGTRLVFAYPKDGQEKVELIPYRSDFDELYPRVEALESKQALAAASDPSVYADAIAESVHKVDLLGMEVGLAASATKNTADKVQELEARINAINPIGSADINDPSLAAFKQSVLDEVKKMMAGGKTVPADVEWTKILNTGSTVAEAKVLNGVVYLRGVVTKSIGAGYIANVCQLPPTIPAPLAEMVFPLAMKRTSPSLRAFGYATFQTDGQIGVSCDSSSDTVWLDGISYTAYE